MKALFERKWKLWFCINLNAETQYFSSDHYYAVRQIDEREKKSRTPLWRVSFWPIAFILTQFSKKNFFSSPNNADCLASVKWFAKFVEIIINHKFDVTTTTSNGFLYTVRCAVRTSLWLCILCDSMHGICMALYDVRHLSCHHSS